MLKLRDLTLESNVIQSPMAGCTDLPYRLLAREYGMEFCFLEMVSAEGLIRGNENTGEIMKTLPQDRPLGAQIFGCRPEAMGEAAAIVEGLGYDLLDINFGCPVPKIAGKGSGSALLGTPDLARDIFKAIIRSVKRIPVTVKMRLGVKDASGSEAAVIAKIAEECGLSAVSVHGRTREQGYSGQADYEAIGRVKAAVQIPVIGNGDVQSGEDAKRLKNIAGVDGVMLGRGALGNPWLFKNVQRALNGEPELSPSFEQKKKALLKHLELEIEYREPHTAMLHMRRIACWYFKEIPGAAEFRTKVHTCSSLVVLKQLIEDFNEIS